MAAATPSTEVTYETGGRSKPIGMTIVLPDRQVTDETLRAQLAVEGVNTAFVADLLSDCLTHERGGLRLYRSVAGRTNNPVLKARYSHFGSETEMHVTILETLIRDLGGDPAYVSQTARNTEKADTAS